jgi:DNA-binding transcriptional regulator YiaG
VEYRTKGGRQAWDGARVRALRRHLGLSQDGLAGELGTRQQTVSEWETGRYRPRGASARLLSIVAEGSDFRYEAAGDGRDAAEPPPEANP